MMLNWQIGEAGIIWSFKLNQECPHNCRRFQVQIAYWSAATWTAIVLEWQIYLTQNTYEIEIFDLPVTGTLVYITCLSQYECQHCSLNVISKFAALVSDKHSTAFAEYVLYWTSQTYTWYEAEDVCRQTGEMHLASVTNEEEYILVKAILAGYSYVGEIEQPVRILTPCRLGSILCVMGLRVNVRKCVAAFALVAY